VASEASFKLGGEAPVRSLAVEQALPLPGPGALRGGGAATATVTGGASMGGLSLSSSMFDRAATAACAGSFGAGGASATANAGRGEAPLLSRFYKLQKRSSYRSAADLSRTMLDLETCFANGGVQWRLDGAAVARYECDAFVRGAKLEFAVACFREPAESTSTSGQEQRQGQGQGQGQGQIVVDVVPLSGCCAAFSDLYADLTASLAFAEPSPSRRPDQNQGTKRRRFVAPPLPSTAPPVHIEVPAEAARDEAAQLCDMYMYADGCRARSADAARAVAIKAASPESAHLFFGTESDAGAGAPTHTQLAEAVAKAMLSDETETETARETALLACATIANLAAWVDSDSAAGRTFLAAALPAIKEVIEDSECAHTRRECLRALASMATSRPNTSSGGGAYTSLNATIVRAGMVDLLELEALAGAEEGRAYESEDNMARGFATSALVACRA